MTGIRPDDMQVVVADDAVDLRTADADGMTISLIRLAAGTDLGPALAGLEHDRCPCPHWGYMLEGTLTMRTARGDETYRAGEAFYWSPGHVPVAETDCAYVDVSPTAEFRAVLDHITGGTTA